MNERTHGWVYLIVIDRRYKVGITTGRISDRMSNYTTHNAAPLKLVELVYVDRYKELEKIISEQFFEGRTWRRFLPEERENIITFMHTWQSQNMAIPDYKKQLVKTLYADEN